MKKLFLVMTLPIFLYFQNVLGEVTFPEGPGREIIYKRCQTCHQLDRIKGKKHSRDEWGKIIDRMIRNGLTISQKNKNIALDYLGTHFGISSSK